MNPPQEAQDSELATPGRALRRRFQLVSRLSRGEGVRVAALAAENGCSRRTIFRDLQFVRESLGIETRYERSTSTVFLESSLSADPMPDSQGQFLLMSTVLFLAPTYALGLLGAAQKSAHNLLVNLMDPLHRKQLDRARKVLAPLVDRAQGCSERDRRLLGRLFHAALDNRIVNVRYREKGSVIESSLNVLQLDQGPGGEWTILGNSSTCMTPLNLPLNSIDEVTFSSHWREHPIRSESPPRQTPPQPHLPKL